MFVIIYKVTKMFKFYDNYTPLQKLPLCLYPSLQKHEYPPFVFLQYPFLSQGLLIQSLISTCKQQFHQIKKFSKLQIVSYQHMLVVYETNHLWYKL